MSPLLLLRYGNYRILFNCLRVMLLTFPFGLCSPEGETDHRIEVGFPRVPAFALRIAAFVLF